MHINLPDPNPGRCKNHRSEWGRSYRCLNYENEKHECEFDIPWRDPDGPLSGSNNVYSYSQKADQTPWVKPSDRNPS